MARSVARTLAIGLSVVLSILVLVCPSVAAQGSGGEVTLEWLGWNAWRITSPGGKVILTNPFVTNPDQIVRVENITQADLILVSDGHGDEVGQAVDIARNTGARIVPGGFGLGTWFTDQGLPAGQVSRVSPGDRVRSDGITIHVLNNIHGSDITRPSEATLSGGIAGSFMVTFENGWTLYYGASGAATEDMALWARLYRPDAAILYMGTDKDPMDFALAVSLLMTDNPNLSTIFPGHHRFMQPPGATTIAEVDEALRTFGIPLAVTEPAPGQLFTFTR